MMIIRKYLIALAFLGKLAVASEPVAIDTRIKTLIYTQNQIFRVDANYGYQSFIEFADNEKVKTIAIGDAVSWKINPAGNKIFIRPFEKTGRTNMTVITNRRTYVFDLVARSDSDEVDQNLTYVVRFFYPTKDDEFLLGQDSASETVFSLSGKSYNLEQSKMHQNYSISGDKSISPQEVLDNSRVTFFKFRDSKIPRIFIVNEDKSETQAKMVEFKNYIVIDGVHKRISLRYKDLISDVTNNDLS